MSSQASTPSAAPWTPSSWRSKPVSQPVDYPESTSAKLESVVNKLNHLPPLVTHQEIERLRSQLADVANNKAFLLHGGDCAELFEYCNSQAIEQKISLLLLSSLVIVFGGRSPVVRILRGAGQYAKPRSKPTETVDGREVLSFRGENVNGIEIEERDPDPERLLSAYFHSAATLNYIRTLLASGFADLHNPRTWSMTHVRKPELAKAFEEIVERLEDSLDFLKIIGAEKGSEIQNVDLWTSHEGLMLEYEEALTRKYTFEGRESWYNTSAHFLWIGDRTRQLTGAHIQFFKGVRNPIGIKAGPTLQPEELVRLLDIIDPDFEDGKVTIIGRYGAGKVDECLPGHIKAVQGTKHKVVWCADIMHGNGVSVGKYKTRHLQDLVRELVRSFEIHQSLGSRLNGVHLEQTGELDANGESVTEILGGSMELDAEELPKRYNTFCDARLNMTQSLDIAFLISDFLQAERRGKRSQNTIYRGLASRETSRDRLDAA